MPCSRAPWQCSKNVPDKKKKAQFNRKAFIPSSTSTWLISQLLSFTGLLLTFSSRSGCANISVTFGARRGIHSRRIQSHSGVFKCTFKRLRVVLTARGHSDITSRKTHPSEHVQTYTAGDKTSIKHVCSKFYF